MINCISEQIGSLNFENSVITSAWMTEDNLSNYLDKRVGGNVTGDVSVSTKIKSRWLDVERPTQQLNNAYTTDAYIACGSNINVGFMYFPINSITADSENSIISIDC